MISRFVAHWGGASKNSLENFKICDYDWSGDTRAVDSLAGVGGAGPGQLDPADAATRHTTPNCHAGNTCSHRRTGTLEFSNKTKQESESFHNRANGDLSHTPFHVEHRV